MRGLVLLLLLLLADLQTSVANLNLYLSQGEVRRLLGLENELFYVRDGTINQYAIGFVIPIPGSVDILNFSWFLSSPILPLNYKLTFGSTDMDIIPEPTVNISAVGTIPTSPQIWGVNVGCTGRKAGETVITIDLILNRVDVTKVSNTTLLSFKRKKVCQIFEVETKTRDEVSTVPAYVIFFAAVGGCLLFLILLFVTVIVTWMRGTRMRKYNSVSNHHQHQQQQSNDLTVQTSVSQTVLNRSGGSQFSHHTAHLSNQSAQLDLQRPSRDYQDNYQIQGSAVMGSSQPLIRHSSPRIPSFPFQGVEYKPAPARPEELFTSDVDSGFPDIRLKRAAAGRLIPPIAEIAVDRLSLTLGDLLHEGTFGRVYQGRLDIDCDSEDVMVKTVVMGSSAQQTNKLVSEGSSLYGINQKHVLPLIATTYDGSSPMMMYPCCYPGNLKRWLSSHHQSVNTHQAVCLGLQLLTALKHLHKRGIIHKDVATRNCYLGSPMSVKLCDSALSRDLFPNDYHCLGDNENRPVKWMAVECISGEAEMTSACDVWSWGVTIWEILTRAQQPFPDVDPFEMENYLLEGFRLHQPLNCPDQLYTVMASCWAHSANHRTSVHNLYSHLSKFSNQLQEFV